MTADHARAMWTPDVAFSATPRLRQFAFRRGMIYPVQPDAVDGGSPLVPVRGGNLWPYAIPNPVASDAVGVAFPAGLVAIVGAWGSYGTGDFNTRLAAYWTQTFGSTMWLVPGVLPSGYTPRLDTRWMSPWTFGSFIGTLDRVGSAAGWAQQQWVPTTDAFGGTDFILGSDWSPASSNPAYKAFRSSNQVGYRNISMRARYPGMGSTFATGYGNITVTLSHNADGSNPGLAVGDTVDGVVTFSDSDFSNIGSGTWATGYKGNFAALAARGVSTQFSLKGAITDPTKAVGFGLDFNISGRCDVPFPCTVTGEGDLIAPGGTP